MTVSTKFRILGYIAILAIHISNMRYMGKFSENRTDVNDERILAFKGVGNRFFTIWNLLLQISYTFLSLVCDIINSFNKKTYISRYIDGFREMVFSSLVWPSSLVVSSIFWTLYTYDRSLIFPEYMDEFLPRISNHVIHTAIVPIVLFELVCRPRLEPATHWWNVLIVTGYIGSYLGMLMYTYYERGLWLYPIFGQLYGSVGFLLALAIIYALVLISYFVQWPLTKMIHGSEAKKTRKSRKKRA